MRAVVAGIGVALIAGGCGGGSTGAAADPTSASPSSSPLVTAPVTTVAPASVRIGFLGNDAGASTGPVTNLNRTVEDGVRLAVSQFTSDHPAIAVTVLAPAAGAAVDARRLAADGAVAVIGPQTSAGVGAALPILSAAGVPAVTATATATDLDGSGWTSFFRAVADDQQQGSDAAAELVTSLHVTTLAVLAGDTGPALTRTTWVSSSAAQLGAAVTAAADVDTATAAADAARQAVGSGVGGVYFSGSTSIARVLVTDLIGDGYQGVVMVASDTTPTVLAPLGSTADGVYVASPADDPAAIAAGGGDGLVFVDDYRAAFGTEPPVWAAEAYDATNIVLGAVASGATTGPAVGAYLFNHTWAGVSHRLAFDSSGDQVDPPVFVSRIDNGVPVQIATAEPPSS